MTSSCRGLGTGFSRFFHIFRAVVLAAGVATVALPASAATTVGAIPGEFSVTATGAASYSIPFDLPPGVNGMTPRLGLVYNSRAGDGLVGVGWSVSGLSVISRCRRTIAQDGAIRGIEFDSGDRFCLDGNRLRLSGGTYGGSGATYRTEINHFARITSEGSASGGPAWFKVETPDGRVLEYGHAGNSAVAAANGAIRVWRLNRIEDPDGNFVAFSYTQSGSIGVARPASISYGGKGGVSVHTVSFDYESRQDVYTRYRAGTTLQETHRLKLVTVKYGSAEVRRYELDYGTGTRSRLIGVTECGGSLCLPATTFQWQAPSWAGEQGDPAMQSTQYSELGQTGDGYFRLINLNGDGFADLLYRVGGHWWTATGNADGSFDSAQDTGRSASNYEYVHLLDYNGDGLTDVLQVTDQGEWQVLTADASGGGGFNAPAYTGVTEFNKDSVRVTDFDGNGLDDFVYADVTGEWYVVPNDSGFDVSAAHRVFVPEEGIHLGEEPHPLEPHSWGSLEGSGSRADFNSDGRDDILALAKITDTFCKDSQTCKETYTYYWQLLVADGDHYESIGRIDCQFNIHDYPPRFADFNGDGLTDLVWIAPADGSNNSNPDGWTWHVWINHDSGFDGGSDTGIRIKDVDGYGMAGGYHQVTVADLNGDGRSDLMWLDAGQYTSDLWVSYGTNTGLGDASIRNGGFGISIGAGDVNGDGLVDILSGSPSYGHVDVTLHQGPYPNLITQIVDGLGNIHEVDYKPSTDSAIYSKGATAAYPAQDLHSSLYVVARYTANNGAGGDYARDYTYSDGRVNVKGRGFLGFASITATDDRDGRTVITQYDQSFPHIGMPTKRVTKARDGDKLRVVENTPDEKKVGNEAAHTDAYFPFVTKRTETQYDLNGSVVRTIATDPTYNLYGQPTKVVVTTEDKTASSVGQTTFTTTTDTTYDANGRPGCRGLPSTVSITRGDETRIVNYVNDIGSCRATSKKVASGKHLELTTDYTYDGFGNIAGITLNGFRLDTDARVTRLNYGAKGAFPVSVTNALGQVTTVSWNYALGVKASAIGPNGNKTIWHYYDLGRKKEVLRPDGATIKWTYGSCDANCPETGRILVSTTLKNSVGQPGGASAVVYDSYGRVVQKRRQVLGGKTSAIDVSYDARGRKGAITAAHYLGESGSVTTWSYDDLDKVSAVSKRTSAGLATTAYSYTGLMTTAILPNDSIKRTQHDALGRIVSVSELGDGDPATSSTNTTYTYTSFGKLETVTDTLGNDTRLEYNDRGMKTDIYDPDMGHWEYRYNAAGELIEQIDAKGNSITQTWDKLGRLETRTELQPDGTSGTTTWTYDSAANGIGLLAAVTSANGFSKSIIYDGLSRAGEVTTTIDGSPYTVNKIYDGFSRLSTVTYPKSAAVTPDNPPVARAGSDRKVVRPATITLDGSGSSDPDGDPLTYLWRQTGGPTVDFDPRSPSITFTANDAAYYTFELRVNDGLKNASDSVSITVQPPAPSFIDLPTLIHNMTYTISWGLVDGVDKYELYEDNDGGVSGADRVYNRIGTSTTRSHGDGYYHYWVRTRENGVPSAWRAAPHATEILLTPGRPVPPTVGPNPSTTGSYTVRWSKRNDNIDVDRYYVQEYVNSGGWHDFYSGGATSETVSNQRNASYHYRVKACNRDGEGHMTCSDYSDASATERVTRKPARPTSISVSPSVVDSLFEYTVSWGAPSGNVPASYYELARAGGGLDYTNLGSVGNVLSKTYRAPKVVQNTDYFYKVRACNAYGCSDWYGAARFTVKDPFHASVQKPGHGAAPTDLTPPPGSGATRRNVLTARTQVRHRPSMSFTYDASDARASAKAAIDPDRGFVYAPPVYRARQNWRLTRVGYGIVPPPPSCTSASNCCPDIYGCEPDPCGILKICEPPPPCSDCEPPPPPEDDPPPPPEPYRLKVEYHYDESGMLEKVTDANGSVYWQALGANARAQYQLVLLGNGVGTATVYDLYTGALTGRSSGIGLNTNVQRLLYTYDRLGNLKSREDVNQGLTETFTYDDLNRLIQSDLTTNGTTTTNLKVTYDEIGNIKSKSGVGTYTYDTTQPHAVDSISGAINTSYEYDANGNIKNGNNKTYAWTAFNKPWRIDSNGNESQFWYGPSRDRYKQVATDAGGVTTTTLYIGGLFAVIAEDNAPVKYRHKVIVGGHAIAIYTNDSDLTQHIRYLHYDVQGSVNAVTDGSGTVVARMSFSAFGQRRDPSDWQGPPTDVPNDRDQTFRGYTGHEQLDALGLIHMNGRVYDPIVGRFTSADPYVQAPYNSQSLNRYSYAWNNPMTYTDPSGYFTKMCGTVSSPGGSETQCYYFPEPSDYALAYEGSGGSRGDRRGGRGPFVGGSTGGRGTARTMASEQSGNSSSLKIDKKELAKTLGQVLEAGKTGTGLLGKIFSATDATQLSVSLLNTTIQVGLRDIRQYRAVGLHLISMQGSVVNWRQFDWSRWDTGGSPEQTMSNLFRAAMKEND